MKTLLIFVIGAAAGAFAFYYFQQDKAGSTPEPRAAAEPPAAKSSESTQSLSQKAADKARAARDAVSEKIVEWHLTPDEIKADLKRTGQVVRTKAEEVGSDLSAKTSNARIITVIKAKYTLDKELSARAIEVECAAGVVTLRGSVANPTLIAKAVGLALDTDGVTKVNSLLVIAEKS